MNRNNGWAVPVCFVVLALIASGLACGRGDSVTPTSRPAQPLAGQTPTQQVPAEPPPEEQPQAPGVPVIDYFYAEAAPTAGCFYLQWGLHGATAAYLNGEGITAPGSTEVCPEAATTYTLRAENEAGSVEETVTVDVSVSPEEPGPPSVTAPSNLEARVEGSSVVITWNDAGGEASYILMYLNESVPLPADATSYTWQDPPCGTNVLIGLLARDAGGAEIGRLQASVDTPACAVQSQTITLQSLPAEDGYVRGLTDGESVSLDGNVKVGDGNQNRKWVAFLSFDISGIPQGATIQAATLDLSNHTFVGDPFTTLGPLGIYFVQYGDLDTGDYVADWPAGRAATLSGPPTVLNPAHHLQQLLNGGRARCQVRLHFQYITDNDDQADGLLFPEGGPALTVTFVP
jgi:hypothetical protein